MYAGGRSGRYTNIHGNLSKRIIDDGSEGPNM